MNFWSFSPRQVAGRPRGRPCRAPRVLDIEEIWGQLIGEATPLFNRVLSLLLIRVGLCSHTILFIAGDVAAWRASDRIRAVEIAWTRVHAITDYNTCLKKIVSGLRSMAYLAPRGRFWSAGSSSNGGHCDHDHHRDLRPSDGGRSSESWTTRSGDRSHSFTWGVIGRLRGHVEELHDRGPIEPRSRRDRAAIVEHLLRNQLHECQTWFL